MKIDIGIVDDEPIVAEFIEEIVCELGHRVVFVAQSATEAQKELESATPKLLFMDINLKGPVDGIELVRKLMTQPKPPQIIYISAYCDQKTVEEASLTLPLTFLPKPFDHKDVEVALILALQKIKTETKLEEPCTNKRDLGQGYSFCFEGRFLKNDDGEVSLTSKELKLLEILASKSNGIVTFKEIINCIWDDKEVSASTLRDLIYRLRKKAPVLNIKCLASEGYRLICP